MDGEANLAQLTDPRRTATTFEPAQDTTSAASANMEKQVPVSEASTVVAHAAETLPDDEKDGQDSVSYMCPVANPFEEDVEALAGCYPENFPPVLMRKTTTARKSDNLVWPGKAYWKQRAKAAKVQRSCSCMANMSRRNRWIAKVLIVLLVVGIAVGVGFGISKPLGAPIWGSHSH